MHTRHTLARINQAIKCVPAY